MHATGITHVLEDRRRNALVSWFLVVLLGGIALESWIDYDLFWAWFTTFVIGLAVLPPLAFRRWTVMVPWEVLALAILPIFGWSWDAGVLLAPPLMYLSLGAVALIVAVELDAFTEVDFTESFAVVFVGIATVGAAALLAIAQWFSDRILGTGYIITHDQLMQGFIAATGAGVLGGVLFAGYVRRVVHRRVGGDGGVA